MPVSTAEYNTFWTPGCLEDFVPEMSLRNQVDKNGFSCFG